MATGKIGAGGRGFGKEGSTSLGSAGTLPPPPGGFIYLLGADGAYLKGADGAYLLGVAP